MSSKPGAHPNTLPVMEMFYTIQGEGAFTGHAAYFIRLAGCDVGCHWCDVKDSWTIDESQYKPVKTIVAEAAKHPARVVVITGGEPLMHNLNVLCSELKLAGFRVHIETSGSSNIQGGEVVAIPLNIATDYSNSHPSSHPNLFNWVCLSPKKFKMPLQENYAYANELKMIVFNKSDLVFAQEEAKKVPVHCKLYLQPEWSKRDEMMPVIIDFVKQNPQWQICLQSHKYMGVD